jgi:hypothetical protein
LAVIEYENGELWKWENNKLHNTVTPFLTPVRSYKGIWLFHAEGLSFTLSFLTKLCTSNKNCQIWSSGLMCDLCVCFKMMKRSHGFWDGMSR